VLMGVMIAIFGKYTWRSLQIVYEYLDNPDKVWFWRKYMMLFSDLNYRRLNPTIQMYWIFFRTLIRFSLAFCVAIFEGETTLQYASVLIVMLLYLFTLFVMLRPFSTIWRYA
jgi:hypothetical protein